MQKEKHHLKIELDEKEFEMFNNVKVHYGIKNNTDVIRICIKDAFRVVEEREKILKSAGKKTD